mmetsp:Transcript_30621/g.63961  ORF Transcript_30621/g.63961 Transcript_30621/m.63961 type:complete len:230 (-) Transcript_30621:129-818(-)
MPELLTLLREPYPPPRRPFHLNPISFRRRHLRWHRHNIGLVERPLVNWTRGYSAQGPNCTRRLLEISPWPGKSAAVIELERRQLQWPFSQPPMSWDEGHDLRSITYHRHQKQLHGFWECALSNRRSIRKMEARCIQGLASLRSHAHVLPRLHLVKLVRPFHASQGLAGLLVYHRRLLPLYLVFQTRRFPPNLDANLEWTAFHPWNTNQPCWAVEVYHLPPDLDPTCHSC